jgi:hypothetical protein
MIEWCIQVSQLRAAYKRDGYPDSEALDLAVHEFARKSTALVVAKQSNSRHIQHNRPSRRRKWLFNPLSLEQWERRHGKGARR